MKNLLTEVAERAIIGLLGMLAATLVAAGLLIAAAVRMAVGV
jgi:hypothetical protein